jgi:hypothetical protein
LFTINRDCGCFDSQNLCLIGVKAAGAYGKFNGDIKSKAKASNGYKFEGKFLEKNYQVGQTQILRIKTTTVSIDGEQSSMVENTFVDTASTGLFRRWTPKKLHDQSVAYLKDFFPGEDSKIKGLTYTTEFCQKLKPAASLGSAQKKGKTKVSVSGGLGFSASVIGK